MTTHLQSSTVKVGTLDEKIEKSTRRSRKYEKQRQQKIERRIEHEKKTHKKNRARKIRRWGPTLKRIPRKRQPSNSQKADVFKTSMQQFFELFALSKLSDSSGKASDEPTSIGTIDVAVKGKGGKKIWKVDEKTPPMKVAKGFADNRTLLGVAAVNGVTPGDDKPYARQAPCQLNMARVKATSDVVLCRSKVETITTKVTPTGEVPLGETWAHVKPEHPDQMPEGNEQEVANTKPLLQGSLSVCIFNDPKIIQAEFHNCISNKNYGIKDPSVSLGNLEEANKDKICRLPIQRVKQPKMSETIVKRVAMGLIDAPAKWQLEVASKSSQTDICQLCIDAEKQTKECEWCVKHLSMGEKPRTFHCHDCNATARLGLSFDWFQRDSFDWIQIPNHEQCCAVCGSTEVQSNGQAEEYGKTQKENWEKEWQKKSANAFQQRNRRKRSCGEDSNDGMTEKVKTNDGMTEIVKTKLNSDGMVEVAATPSRKFSPVEPQWIPTPDYTWCHGGTPGCKCKSFGRNCQLKVASNYGHVGDHRGLESQRFNSNPILEPRYLNPMEPLPNYTWCHDGVPGCVCKSYDDSDDGSCDNIEENFEENFDKGKFENKIDEEKFDIGDQVMVTFMQLTSLEFFDPFSRSIEGEIVRIVQRDGWKTLFEVKYTDGVCRWPYQLNKELWEASNLEKLCRFREQQPEVDAAGNEDDDDDNVEKDNDRNDDNKEEGKDGGSHLGKGEEDGDEKGNDGSHSPTNTTESNLKFNPELSTIEPLKPTVANLIGVVPAASKSYFDPLFSAQVGTVCVEILADTGCINGAKSVCAESWFEQVKRESPECILEESTRNNNLKLKAADKSLMAVVNTVTLLMQVAHQAVGQVGMSRHPIRVETVVVSKLARPFIMSNKDLAGFAEFAVSQHTGHLVFRNYRDANGELANEQSGELVDDLRIPLCENAKRRTTDMPISVKRDPSAIRAKHRITLEPNSEIFYQVPILNATLKTQQPTPKQCCEVCLKDFSTELCTSNESTTKRFCFECWHTKRKQCQRCKEPTLVAMVTSLPKRSKKDHRIDGTCERPLILELEDTLDVSEFDQYMLTTLRPNTTDENQVWSQENLLKNAIPWSVDTLIDSTERHLVRLENRTSERLHILPGETVAYIQRIEDSYLDSEVGCVSMDLGLIMEEEEKLFATMANVNACETESEHGFETEPMINEADDDLPLPLGEKNYEKTPFPWMRNLPLHELEKLPNYRAPTEEDKEAMRNSSMYAAMQTTDVWKNSTVEDREEMQDMLLDYSFLFTTRFAAGTVDKNLIQHDIELVRNEVIRCRQYPLTLQARTEISKWIREMLANGFIEPSNSAFRSPLLVVAKLTSDGKIKGWRTVFDARRVNAATREYPGNPPPSTSQIFSDLSGGLLFSTTDFKAGFYNVQLTDRAKQYTAFADPTDGRLFHFTRMAMGLIGAPATFAALGSIVFHDLISLCMQIYVDDLIIYTTKNHMNEINEMPNYTKRKGPTFSATKTSGKEKPENFSEKNGVGNERGVSSLLGLHRLQLEAVFQRCCKAGLLLAPKKTFIAQRKVNLLGHEVSPEGLRPCRLKTAAMRLAPSPADVPGVRRALGCFGFYRRFVPRFSQATTNMRKMLKKGAKFNWSKDMEKEYVEIKNILSSAPLVAPPDYSKEFFILTDGSKVGLAGMVFQKNEKGELENVIGYWSRALTPAESNYDARELETLAVLGTITKYRSVLPTKFTLYTDHLNLLKLSTYVSHKTRLSSWSNRLSVYKPTIEHIPGKKNFVADWLSRAPWRPSHCPMIACVSQVIEGVDDLKPQTSKETCMYQKVQVDEEFSFLVSGEENQYNQWLSLEEVQSVTVFNFKQGRHLEEEDSVAYSQNAEEKYKELRKTGVLLPPLNKVCEVYTLSPGATRHPSSKPSTSIRSKATAPKRLTMKDFRKSQRNDPHFRRVLWYKDIGPALRRDDRKCERQLEAAHKRFQAQATGELKDQAELALGPFQSLEKLRFFAAPYDVDEKGTLRVKGRPSKGALSRTTIGFKDEELGENPNELERPPVCVGQSIQQQLLWFYHDSMAGNHQGFDHTLDRLRKTFYWPNMANDTKKYCLSCLRCRRAKQSKRERWRNVGSTPIPKGLYHTIFLDCVCISSQDGGVTSNRQHTHILSIQDRLSGHCNLIPIRLVISDEQRARRQKWEVSSRSAKGKQKEKLLRLLREDSKIMDERSAVVVATELYNCVCLTLHKKPHVIVCDNGTEFANALLKQLSSLMQIRLVALAPENARANFVERIHSMIGQRLKILTNDSLFPDKRNWDRYVKYIQHALNSRSIVDRVSPAECMFGRCDMLLVDELDKKIAVREAMGEVMPNDRLALVNYAHEMVRRQRDISIMFGNEILHRQEQLAKRYDRKKRYKEYYAGDLVLLHRKNVGSKQSGSSSKLNLKWSGPHEVIGRIHGSDVYKIQLYNSTTTLRAPSDLLAPLGRDVVARPVERTLWNTDLPRCAADLFPVQGDKMILLGIPSYLKSSIAKVSKGLEFYVVEFQRKIKQSDDCENWEVLLMGNAAKRAASKTIASSVNPLESSHYPAWGVYGNAWEEIPKNSKKKIELNYSSADLSSKGYFKHKLLVTDEAVLPITPFQLNASGKIPKATADRIKLVLEHWEPTVK